MKKPILFLLIFTIAACSGAKHFYNKGTQLQQAGLNEEAVGYYLQSLDRDPSYIPSKIALKQTGQEVMDRMYADFYKSHSGDDHKDAVYRYQHAEKFRKDVARRGIALDVAPYYEAYYKESLKKYLEELYAAAQEDMYNERYREAEQKLREIASLSPEYENVTDLKKVARIEPLYRKALEAFDNNNFRDAYMYFSQVQDIDGNYRDSRRYMDLTVEKGRVTVGLMPFKNSSRLRGADDIIRAAVVREIQEARDPFLRMIDRTNTQVILQEQELGMIGPIDQRTAARAGELLGAKALLLGHLINAEVSEGDLKKYSRPGYSGRQVRVKNPVTGETGTRWVYDKVFYQEYEQKNTVSLTFQYQLVSSETGEILATDVVDISRYDEVNYARFNGDTRYLYAGDWTSQTRDNPSDKVLNSYQQKRQLDQKLQASDRIRSSSEMANEAYREVAKKVAANIISQKL